MMDNIVIDAELYDELMAVSRWYEAMPSNTSNFYAGDRFHDNVFEFRMSCIPEGAIDFDKNYVAYFEIQDDELYVIVGDQEFGEEAETPVKITTVR